MIEMRMEDQDLPDLFRVDSERLHLFQNVREYVAHRPVNQDCIVSPFKNIDPRFLTAQVPEILRDLSRLSESHKFHLRCMTLSVSLCILPIARGLSFGFSGFFQTCEPFFDFLHFFSRGDIQTIKETCCRLFHLIFQVFFCLL